MIVTIDGPAGSGKSAAALLLARRLGFYHLDTGAMYRTVALFALESDLLSDPPALAAACPGLDIHFDFTAYPAPVFLGVRNVSDLIRTPQVTAVTYVPSDNPAVRADLVRRQREIGVQSESPAGPGGLVTEGRDQGSIVFPNARYKFYIDAKAEERARRRVKQLAEKGVTADFDELLQQIIKRDAQDMARPVGGLKQTPDSIILDTTPLTLDQVVDTMYQMVCTGAAS